MDARRIGTALLRWGAAVLLAWVASLAPAHAADKMIVVDWDAGLVYPVQGGKLATGPLITNPGRYLREKYLGAFTISEKVLEKYSNMYNIHNKPLQPGDEPAPMRYWMRVGSTAQGFHHSLLFSPEGPRHLSHGCYRLSRASAMWLFQWTPRGTPVYVVENLHDSRFADLADRHRKPQAAPDDDEPDHQSTPAASGRKSRRARPSATSGTKPRARSSRAVSSDAERAKPTPRRHAVASRPRLRSTPQRLAMARMAGPPPAARRSRTAGSRGAPAQPMRAAMSGARDRQNGSAAAPRTPVSVAPPARRNTTSAARPAPRAHLAPGSPLQALLARIRRQQNRVAAR